jgi:hypothetical protein
MAVELIGEDTDGLMGMKREVRSCLYVCLSRRGNSEEQKRPRGQQQVRKKEIMPPSHQATRGTKVQYKSIASFFDDAPRSLVVPSMR